MTNNSDFPRGWTLTSRVVGGTATIIVPAAVGAIPVIDSFDAKLISNDIANAATAQILLSTSDGIFTNLVLGQLATSIAPAATTYEIDTTSLSSIDIAPGPGSSVTIKFSAAGTASMTEILIVQGHYI